MLKVLSYILCDLDPKVKVIGQKAGICDGVPSTSALVMSVAKIQVHFRLHFIMEANTINPERRSLIWVHIVCNIGYLRTNR